MLLISFIPFCPLYFGFEAVYKYLWIMFSFRYFGIITIPVIILCVLYQIWYFRKNSNLF